METAVTYSSALTQSDVRDYMEYTNRLRSRSYSWWSWAAFVVALVAPIPMIFAIQGGSGNAQEIYFVTVGTTLLTLSLLNSLIARHARRLVSGDSGVLTAPRRFIIRPDGLGYESGFSTGFVPWSGVREIGRTNEIVIFWFDSSSAYCASAQAKSELPDAEPIYQLATRLRRAALGQPSAIV